MKSLRVFVCILVTTVSILSAFSTPERVVAAGYTSSTFTHEIAKSSVTPLFQSFINAINAGLQTASALKTDDGIKRYNNYKTVSEKLIPMVTNAASIYNSSYNTSLSPPDAQLEALKEVQKYFGANIPAIFSDIKKVNEIGRAHV